jgi:hypothetical protein
MDPYLVTAMIFDTCVLNSRFAKLFPTPMTAHKFGSKLGSRGKGAGSFHESESEDAGSEGSEGFHMKSPRRSDLKKKAGAKAGPPQANGKNNGCAAIM